MQHSSPSLHNTAVIKSPFTPPCLCSQAAPLRCEGNPGSAGSYNAYSKDSGPKKTRSLHSCTAQPRAYSQPQDYLDMLSGEQAELPVEMLVSMLSELSRLRVSYAWSSSSARGLAPWAWW